MEAASLDAPAATGEKAKPPAGPARSDEPVGAASTDTGSRSVAAPEPVAQPTEADAEASEGCAVPDNVEPDNRDPGSCAYRATRSGGYVGGGDWVITIVRAGERLRFTSRDAPACATGVIEPGDEVYASLGVGVGGENGGMYVVAQDSWLRVGSAEHC